MPSSGLSVLLVEFSPSGGLYQFAYQQGEALAARGHKVDLLTGPDPELVARVPGMTVTPTLPTWHPADGASNAAVIRKVRRAWRAVRYIAAWRAVARHVRRTRPDVVQWSNWRFALDGARVARLARETRRWPHPPVLAYLAHSPRPFNEQRRDGQVFKDGGALERGLARGYAAMDVVFALGPDSARDLREHFPEIDRVAVVPHGDEDVFLTDDPDPGDDGPVVLFFGTLQAYKGVDVLVEAFSEVRSRVPAARLVIAGAASGEVDTAALTARAAEIGGVRLRFGYVPVPEVAPLVRAARVVALPYRNANASGVAHLAHSFSRAVVTTSVGDLTSSVVDGKTGLVVPPADASALAEALTELLTDPTRAKQMGAEGRASLAERASWPDIAERMESAVRAAQADRQAGPDGPAADAAEPGPAEPGPAEPGPAEPGPAEPGGRAPGALVPGGSVPGARAPGRPGGPASSGPAPGRRGRPVPDGQGEPVEHRPDGVAELKPGGTVGLTPGAPVPSGTAPGESGVQGPVADGEGESAGCRPGGLTGPGGPGGLIPGLPASSGPGLDRHAPGAPDAPVRQRPGGSVAP